jgi:two-component system, chemotaxis family, sensor kinase Cph1
MRLDLTSRKESANARDRRFCVTDPGKSGASRDRAHTVQRLRREAEIAVRAREMLLAVVSHELRNEVGLMLAISELLLLVNRETHIPPERDELERMQRSAMRMGRLIGDLLDFSAMQAGHVAMERRADDAARLVDEAIRCCAASAGRKSLTLKAHRTPRPLPILCDGDRILQVLSNLIGNAIKFTPHGGSITVACDAGGQEALLSVSDTGPGVPTEVLPGLFEPYRQTAIATRMREGIGLGLYISKTIVEAHGGRIWVDSAATGATFRFVLPLADGSAIAGDAGAHYRSGP